MAGNQANVKLGIHATASGGRAFQQTRNQMRGLQRGVGGVNSHMKRNRRIIQQAGMQMSDFAVQIGGGQDAILAFTQNAPQFIQNFGAIGGVAAALVTIFGTLTLVLVKTGVSMSKITPIAGVLEDEFKGLVSVIASTKEFFIDFANAVINNLDRVLVYIAAFIGLMLGKWVAGFVIARGVVGTLTFALVALRAVLRSFLILAAFAVFAELVFTFVKLVKVTGSFGGALDALKPLARNVARIISVSFAAAGNLMKSAMLGAASAIMGALSEVDQFVVGMIRGSLKGLVSIVAFLTQRDMGHLVDEINGVETSFSKAAEMAEWLNQKSGAAAGKSSEQWKSVHKLAKLSVEEFKKLRELVNTGGGDIDIRDWFGGGDKDDPTGGMKDKIKSLADEIGGAFKNSFDRLFDSIFDGGLKAIDVLRDLGKEILKIVTKKQFFGFLASAFPGTFGKDGFVDLTKNANGNAFVNGRVSKFAKGGVVNGPTMFPMRNGAGLMGEAGAEGILPLSRRNGRLGVDATGVGGAPVNIQMISQPGVETTYEQDTSGGQVSHRFVSRQIDKSLASGRNDAALKSRFGVGAQGTKR